MEEGRESAQLPKSWHRNFTGEWKTEMNRHIQMVILGEGNRMYRDGRNRMIYGFLVPHLKF